MRTITYLLCLTVLVFPTIGAVLEVGPGQQYESLNALPKLQPGDVVEIHSGVYKSFLKFYGAGTAAQPITFRGVGPSKPVFDGRGLVMEVPRAFFEFYGTTAPPVNSGTGYWIIENLEFRYAQNRESSMNAACVRNVNTNVIIRNIKCWNNMAGIMSSEESGLTQVEDSDVGFNGQGSGLTHNFYLMGERAVLKRNKIHDSIAGQNVKTRNHFVELSYNEIYNSRDGEIGIIQAGQGNVATSGLTSQPNSNAIVVGNVITTRADRAGGNCCTVVVFGRDMGTIGRNGTLFFYGNTVNARNPLNTHLKLLGSESGLDARFNTFLGSKNILDLRDPTNKPIVGTNNWLEPGAKLVPAGFSTPAQFPYMDPDGAPLTARPGLPSKTVVVPTPANITSPASMSLQWDPVPGAAFYRIYRQNSTNGKLGVNPIWGGSTEPNYTDMFLHYPSTATKKLEYLYRVAAVDADGNESVMSAPLTLSRAVQQQQPRGQKQPKVR